jgi:hypothetical protein
MVDIVVDGKAADKAPYDPNDIPLAVRNRVAEIEKRYGDGITYAGQPLEHTPLLTAAQTKQLLGEGNAPVKVDSLPSTQAAPAPTAAPASPAQAPVPVPQPPVAQPAVEQERPVTPAPEEDPNSNTWKSRHQALQGRHAKEVNELQSQLTQLGNELLFVQQQQRAPQQARPSQQQPQPAYLTQQDVQNYGSELLDVAQRAALQVVQPRISDLEAQNAELRRLQAVNQRHVLDQQVELAVPDWREIDRNQRWHQWLLGIDPFTGRVRQTLLNDAIQLANAPRVISFFNGFKKEEAATGHIESAPSSQQAQAPREPTIPLSSLASPGRARPATGGNASLPQDKPIYTRAQIAELYSHQRRGAYVGREADWARAEADIYAAQREGRIR